MSCRIDRVVNEEDLVVLRISGRITAQELGVLWDLLGQERGRRRHGSQRRRHRGPRSCESPGVQ